MEPSFVDSHHKCLLNNGLVLLSPKFLHISEKACWNILTVLVVSIRTSAIAGAAGKTLRVVRGTHQAERATAGEHWSGPLLWMVAAIGSGQRRQRAFGTRAGWRNVVANGSRDRRSVVQGLSHCCSTLGTSQRGRCLARQATGVSSTDTPNNWCARPMVQATQSARRRLQPRHLSQSKPAGRDSTATATSQSHRGRQVPWRNKCTHSSRRWSSKPRTRTSYG